MKLAGHRMAHSLVVKRTKSRSVGDGWCSGCTGCAVLGIILLSVLNFCVVARGSAILDAVTDVEVGVDALANVIW